MTLQVDLSGEVAARRARFGRAMTAEMSLLDGLPHRAVRIGGFPVIDADADALSDRLVRRMDRSEPVRVAFFNTNLLIKLREAGSGADRFRRFVFLNDGIAASAAAALVSGRFFETNLNGTDLTPRLLAKLPAGTRVFLYGARPEVVREAGQAIAARFDVRIVGTLDGYSTSGAQAADAVAQARADVVLVALGNPLQEEWIRAHGDRTGAKMLVGVGALFDFMSQRVRRAPAWMRACRLEWAFRLFSEPRRLLRRYSVDMLVFFGIVLRDRASGLRPARWVLARSGALRGRYLRRERTTGE